MDYSDMSNDYFSNIFQYFDTEQLNVLEMKYLELIHYDTYVKFSTYGRFYLEIKNAHGYELPIKQTDKATMDKLENFSKNYGEKSAKYSKTTCQSKEHGMMSKFVIS